MKQAVIVVPLFLLLLTILYLFIPVFPERKTHESFISSDAQIVITQYDLKDRVAEFGSSPLGQALAELNYETVSRELGFSNDEITQFYRLRDEIRTTYQNPLVQMLISKEITVALLPFVHDNFADLNEQLIDHLLVISRPSQSARLMDVATWAISGDERVSTARYGGHDITRFDLENSSRLSVARVKDLVVMSLNERILRHSLDVYDSEQKGLKENNEYMDKIDQFNGASLVGYFNFDGLVNLVNRAILESSSANSKMRLLDKKKVDAYSSAIFGAWRKENSIVDKAIISFDPNQLDDSSQASLSSETTMPESHKQVAEDTIVYHWTNQFDPANLFDMVGEEQSDTKSMDYGPIIDDLAKITGLTLPQIFDLFGNELTFAVRNLNEDQLVPLPRFLLSVKSTDIDQMRTVTDTLINHYSIPVRRKTFDNAEIISWGGIIGIGSVLPALSFANEAVIVSSNRAQIRDYIGPHKTKSLADNPTFIEMGSDILKPSHSITFLDFARTTEMVQEMVSWGGTMLAIKDRELARKSKVLIDDLINPLLDGLAMYSIIGSRKYQEDNTIVFESFTQLDNGIQ
ncbi:MAG: DUF3352 domain-containing protein [Desulfofustis sp.]|nr:DUF3352 domain-containing protein [Desulfofustis sp.]